MEKHNLPREQLTVVGLGEALFDSFSPARLVLGGAPVNLAVHAHQLLQGRGRGVVASAVGQDELGNKLLDDVSRRGMITDYVAVSSRYPTSTVEVEIDPAGDTHYEITEGVAWDHLEFTTAWGELAPQCSAVCFGTLAQRSPESRAAIQKFLLNAPQTLQVCDLNLRQHFYSAELIRECLQAAQVLKLNENELTVVAKALDLEAIDSRRDELVMKLLDKFRLRMVALTQGEKGTVLFTADERVEADVPTYPKQANADSVGAGDACCAAIIVGLLLEGPLQDIVSLANRVGAYVASQPGATPILPREILERI